MPRPNCLSASAGLGATGIIGIIFGLLCPSGPRGDGMRGTSKAGAPKRLLSACSSMRLAYTSTECAPAAREAKA